MSNNRQGSLNSSSSIYYNENEQGRRLADDNNSLKSEKLGKVTRSNQFLIPSALLDIAILTSLAVFAYYLRFTDVFTVFHRYFDCNDTNLQYPNLTMTPVIDYVFIYVNDNVFYCVSTLAPLALILCGELFYKYCGPIPTKVVSTITPQLKIPLMLRRVCRYTGVFWIGLLTLSILTDSIKLLAGRHRPYFLNIPELSPTAKPSFIEQQTVQAGAVWCIIKNLPLPTNIREGMLSFPSYYATISFYSASFCICYIYIIANVHGNYFLRPILSAAFAGMALLATFTRWMLYYNFWEDLLIGCILGIAAGTYISFGILDAFEEHDDEMPPPTQAQGRNQMPEARPGIFRFLPRLTMRRRPRPYPGLGVYNNNGGGADIASAFRPNDTFQQDLAHTIQNFDAQNEQLEHQQQEQQQHA